MARKQFKIIKALQLSGAIIDGAKAVTAALAMSPVAIGIAPNPVGIASLATAVTTSALNIAKIASTQFQSTGGGSNSASVSPPSTSANASSTTDITVPNTPTQTSGLGGSAGKVVIVDSEIKTKLAEMNQADVVGSFG